VTNTPPNPLVPAPAPPGQISIITQATGHPPWYTRWLPMGAIVLGVLSVTVLITYMAVSRDDSADAESPRPVVISDEVQGKWRLIWYAGRSDQVFQGAEGELLMIDGNQFNAHFAENTLVPIEYGVNQMEEVYTCHAKRIVFWTRTEANLLVTVIDRSTEQVDWRGCYTRQETYNAILQVDEKTAMRILAAAINDCKRYWYDLYDDEGPLRLSTPMRIKSKGYRRTPFAP
jgi:hypothetical protein